jgi:hypothetical protein
MIFLTKNVRPFNTTQKSISANLNFGWRYPDFPRVKGTFAGMRNQFEKCKLQKRAALLDPTRRRPEHLLLCHEWRRILTRNKSLEGPAWLSHLI